MENKDYELKMDGEFHQFEGGGTRYTKTGKGRFDLMPPEVINRVIDYAASNLYGAEESSAYSTDDAIKTAFNGEYERAIIAIVTIDFVPSEDKGLIKKGALHYAYCPKTFKDFIKGFSIMLRRLAVHYEKGADKYGVDNWKKGIPLESFRDSGLRHLCQWISGEEDEPHSIAAIWNFFCAIYTINYAGKCVVE